MLLLRMISVDLRPGFADFFDDDELLMVFDNALDRSIFVPWDQHETEALSRDEFVLRWTNFDRAEARCASAFAVKREGRLDPVLPSAFLDALIDFPEDLLVPRRPFSKVHAGILTDLPLGHENPANRGIRRKGITAGARVCPRLCCLPLVHFSDLDGKQGVDGSSPSEGLKYLQIGLFCCLLRRDLERWL